MPKHYDSEYKKYVCRLAVEEGRKMSDLSRELDIPYSTLGKWVRKYKKEEDWRQTSDKKRGTAQKPIFKTPSDYEKEITSREKEINKLQEENDILKKAMHVFTQIRE